MIKIEAIIRHYKLDDVKAALTANSVSGMTVSEVRGLGRQKGYSEAYRGVEYAVDFVPRVKVEVVVSDGDYSRTVEILRQAASTGEVGDGRIFVVDLEEAFRVRTGESSDAAV